MEAGELVVVSCTAPREKFFGVLVALAPVGATVRGVPIDAFEDWMRQVASEAAPMIGPVTIFLPAHRLDRIEVDESAGAVEGFADRFRRVAQRDPREVLLHTGLPHGGAAAEM